MSPGRALDVLIAEKVMGLEVQKDRIVRGFMGVALDLPSSEDPVEFFIGDTNKRVLKYSTDIEAAWMVVEKSNILRDYLLYQHHDGWIIQSHSEIPFCEGWSAPHVICLSALKAVEYK